MGLFTVTLFLFVSCYVKQDLLVTNLRLAGFTLLHAVFLFSVFFFLPRR
jgi:hypothetical protein